MSFLSLLKIPSVVSLRNFMGLSSLIVCGFLGFFSSPRYNISFVYWRCLLSLEHAFPASSFLIFSIPLGYPFLLPLDTTFFRVDILADFSQFFSFSLFLNNFSKMPPPISMFHGGRFYEWLPFAFFPPFFITPPRYDIANFIPLFVVSDALKELFGSFTPGVVTIAWPQPPQTSSYSFPELMDIGAPILTIPVSLF